MVRERIEPWHRDEDVAAWPRGTRELFQQIERVGDVLEHMMHDDEIEGRLARDRVETMMPHEGGATGGLYAVGVPATRFQHIEELAPSAAEVERSSAARRAGQIGRASCRERE